MSEQAQASVAVPHELCSHTEHDVAPPGPSCSQERQALRTLSQLARVEHPATEALVRNVLRKLKTLIVAERNEGDGEEVQAADNEPSSNLQLAFKSMLADLDRRGIRLSE